MKTQDKGPLSNDGTNEKFVITASLRLKFVLFITFPVAAVFIALQHFLTESELEETGAQIEADLLQSASNMALRLELELNRLQALGDFNSRYLTRGHDVTADDLNALTQETVATNSQVFGAAIAYAPNAFANGVELFAPYSFRQDNNITSIDLGDANPAVDYDYRAQDWWRLPLQQQRALWTPPYFDEGAGNILMTAYAVPFTRDGNIVGVTTVDLALENMFETLGLPMQQNGLIINAEGRYLFHEREELILNDTLLSSADYEEADLQKLLNIATSGLTGLMMIPLKDGTDTTWFAYAPISAAGWYYLEQRSEQTALEPVAEKLKLSNFIETSGITALILLIWFLSSLLTKPIRQLSIAAEKMADGDLSIRVKPSSHDEMGSLMNTFNVMGEVVARREEDLARMVERRTRELRAAVDKAEQATKSKGEVLAIASHDLKSPLAAIAGLADVLSMMKRGEINNDRDQELEMLQHINTTAIHMTEVVGDILLGERLEHTGLDLSEFPVDLSELALSVLRLSEPGAAKKDIRFDSDIRAGIDVKADPTRLREALDNYVNNAVKYSPIGGSVTIALVPDDDDKFVTFSVKDEGEGILEEDRSRLFVKFQKLSARPTAGESSHGLGLSIVKSIIELHGGEVGCDSVPDQGSRFWLRLPIQHDFDLS